MPRPRTATARRDVSVKGGLTALDRGAALRKQKLQWVSRFYFIQKFAVQIASVFAFDLFTDYGEAATEPHRLVGSLDHYQLARKLRQRR